MEIDERKKQVLRAVVSLYALEGEPVGSNLLSQYLDMVVSSATLRNDMAALTRLGYLQQPHTSAGRVPSTAGYRYYLDFLMNSDFALNSQEQKIIDQIFDGLDYDPKRLAQGAAKALSDLLGYTVIATTPHAEDMRIAHFELMQAGRYTVCVTAVTSAGGVVTRVAKTTLPLSPADDALLTTLLNRALCFVSAADVTPATLAGLAKALGENAESLWGVVTAAVTLLSEAGQSKTYLEGLQHLVIWSELNYCLPQALELFSNNDATQKLIIPRTGSMTVILGEDIAYKALPELAIMSKKYLAGGGLCGAIAVVGPQRMPYKKLAPALDYFATKMGQIMSGNF